MMKWACSPAYSFVRIAELSTIFKRLYEDSVTGRISDERFTELSADYEAEQKELKEKAAALQSELSKTLEATANAEKFMKMVRKYTSFEELTPTLLREFVKKSLSTKRKPLTGNAGEAPQIGNRNLLLFCRQGRTGRHLKPDLAGISLCQCQKRIFLVGRDAPHRTDSLFSQRHRLSLNSPFPGPAFPDKFNVLCTETAPSGVRFWCRFLWPLPGNLLRCFPDTP